jgi:hypothetical protein
MPINVFEMVIVIVIVGSITGIANNWIKRRDRYRADERDELLDKLKHLEDLEKRVRVLEAVVTDQRYDLKQQFDKLEND